MDNSPGLRSGGRSPLPRRELTDIERRDREGLIAQLQARRAQLQAQLEHTQSNTKTLSKNIFATIRAGHVTQLQALLEQEIYNTKERDYNNCTPLHVASYEGRNDMVSVLLEFGADPAEVDSQGRTARDIALANRHVSCGRLLVKAQLRGLQRQQQQQLAAGTAAGIHLPAAMASPMATGSTASVSQEDASSAPPTGMMGATESSAFLDDIGSPVELNPNDFADEDGTYPTDDAQMNTVSSNSRYCTIADSVSLVVCMVGLPGRGKSFISKRIARYLNWKGVPCKVFNAGNYRRQLLGAEATSGADFYDPNNQEAAQQREEMARLACEDLMKFLGENKVAVGVLDATNTTLERRKSLVDTFAAQKTPAGQAQKTRVIFIESVCTDENIILENILRAKCGNDDFKNVTDSQTVIKDFRERILQYEKVYETTTTDEAVSFIKIKNVKDQITFHNITGGVPTRLGYFLLNLHPVSFPIYLSLPGETIGLVENRFVGDQTLTSAGERYAESLFHFVEELVSDGSKLVVLHATDPCAERTAEYLQGLAHADKIEMMPMQCLDDINAGTFSGLTREEAEKAHPKMSAKLFPTSTPQSSCGVTPLSPNSLGATHTFYPSPNYTIAFPRGESCRQVNVRLETALLQIMRSDTPVLVIAPLVPLQGLTAFFCDVLPEFSPTISVALHQVLEIGIKGNRIQHHIQHGGVTET